MLVTPLEAAPEATTLTRRELREQLAAQVAAADAALVAAAVVVGAVAPASAVAPVAIAPEAIAPAAVVPAAPVAPTPIVTDAAQATALPASEAAASTGPVVDFDTAARLFSFTGETAIPVMAPRRPAAPAFVRAEATATASTRPSGPKVRRAARRWATTAFSAGVMTVIGLMAVSVTVPAEALAAASDSIAVTAMAPASAPKVIKQDEIQAFVAPAEGEVVQLDREQNYALTTFEQIARESGIQMSSNFVNDANSEIQWPFAVGVGMSYGYGTRSGRMHDGIDFTPGPGAQIQAVAPGVVRVATESGGGYGVHVYVDHVIDGQRISSHYAHMQYGSLQVVEGQQVVAGDPIGKVGNTGRSFGAHLHFELRVNGEEAIDPLPWLQKHAGGWQG